MGIFKYLMVNLKKFKHKEQIWKLLGVKSQNAFFDMFFKTHKIMRFKFL